ncbi:DNA polymerase epsilon subunit [Phytophthora palmivora]|uniref:DNA polymerase II subunit 2 n=1 Tax=Phytophthora palmivora TaxID=4796 RepID=A0A2P4XJW4_9STRA|nr:DNA polymerase epsilon subunit [Phytophthora palmivora]
MLGQDERKRFYLEDFTSRIIVDLTNAAYTDGLFTINCVVLVEGEVIDDVLHVQSMGFPPPESKEASLEVLGGIDPLGVEVSAQQREQIRELEANDHHATFIVLSDVHLDDPQVMIKLDELFQGLESVQPTLFILMGDFMSTSIGGGAGSNSLQDLREYLEELGTLILKYPGIAENSRFVLVPGPNDPGSSRAFPRHPLPDLCTRDLIRKVPNVTCTTNPCRIRYYTQDIVIFRDDLQQKMQRHAILPPMPSEQEEAAMDESEIVQSVSQTDISKHLAKTLIDQAHLCPLPLMANPINWDFDSSLQLFPAPDVLILGDSTEQFQLGYSAIETSLNWRMRRRHHRQFGLPNANQILLCMAVCTLLFFALLRRHWLQFGEDPDVHASLKGVYIVGEGSTDSKSWEKFCADDSFKMTIPGTNQTTTVVDMQDGAVLCHKHMYLQLGNPTREMVFWIGMMPGILLFGTAVLGTAALLLWQRYYLRFDNGDCFSITVAATVIAYAAAISMTVRWRWEYVQCQMSKKSWVHAHMENSCHRAVDVDEGLERPLRQ